jgi:hypothetical protein
MSVVRSLIRGEPAFIHPDPGERDFRSPLKVRKAMSHAMRSTLGLALLMTAACQGWHGHSDYTGDVDSVNPPETDSDAGHDPDTTKPPPPPPPPPPKTHDGGTDPGHDAGPDEAQPPRLGDALAKSVACDSNALSCGKGAHCCAADDDTSSYCSADCGPTEHNFGCDGPEDCGKNELCCHHVNDSRLLVGECLTPTAKVATDAGSTTVEQCADVEADEHVACHKDADCPERDMQKQVCRIAKEDVFFGYCRPAVDIAETPGHDEAKLVSCGVGEHPSVCGYEDKPCCVGHAGIMHAGCASGSECGGSELKVICDGPEDCKMGEACFFVPQDEHPDGGVTQAHVACSASSKGLAAGAIERCHIDTDCQQKHQVCRLDTDAPAWGSCINP